MKRFLILSAGLIFMVSFGRVSAEDKSEGEEPFNLGEIVITATQTPQILEDAPGTVSVITSEQIKESGDDNLKDVLENEAGVVITDSGSMGADKTVHIRGSTGNQVLVLIDGTPTAMASLGVTDLGLFPVDNIERVEVVRGPYSVLYGENAFGGVINIITKAAPEKPTTTLNFSYGSFNTGTADISIGAKNGKFGYFITGGDNYSGGFRKNSQCQNFHFNPKFSYDFSDNSKIEVSMGYINQKIGVPGPVGEPYFPLTPLATQSDNREWINISHTLKLSQKAELISTIYYNRQDEVYNDPDLLTLSLEDLTTHEFGAEIHENYSLNSKNLFTYGVSYKKDTAEINDELANTSLIGGNQEISITGVYLQDEIKFLKIPLTIVPGIRYDAPSDFASRVSPKISTLYKLTADTNLRFSIGQAYRAPTIEELYWYQDWGFGMGEFGNPGLKPETTTSWDFGIEHQFNKKLFTQVSYFRNSVDDLIIWEQVPANSWHFEAENIDRALLQGIEAEGQWLITPHVSASLTYTFTHAEDTGSNYGSILPSEPKDKISCDITYHNEKGLNVDLGAEYVSSVYADAANTEKLSGYPLFSASITKDLGKNTQVYLIGSNLTDKKYQIVQYYPMPGISVMLGVRMKI